MTSSESRSAGHRRWTTAGLLLTLCALVAVVLSTASPAAVRAKPTLTIGGSLVDTDGGNVAWNGLAYKPLIFVKPDGSYRPGLAIGWKVAAGNKSITLTLRKGARFSDGMPVDAAAVKTYMAWYAKQPTASTVLGAVRSITVVSRYVVRIDLQKPNPVIPFALSDYFYFTGWGAIASPKAVAQAKADPNHKLLDHQSFGAGQYVYDPSQSVPGNHATWVPNKYYYDQSKIHWGKIVTKQIGDANTALAALKTGQIDVYWLSDWRVTQSAVSAGFRELKALNTYFVVNLVDHGGLNPALRDVRVRQALSYAIDRKTITQGLFGPEAVSSSSPDPGSDGDVPPYTNYYPYNPKKAKALLAAAGYAKGFEIKLLSFGPWVGSAYETIDFCRAVAANWAAIGVKADCQAPDQGQFNHVYGSKTWSAFMGNDNTEPAWAWYSRYMKAGGTGADQHGGRDAAVDALWQKGQRLSGKQALAIWRQMVSRATTDAWEITVARQPTISFFSKKVGGVVPRVLGLGTNNAADWYPTGK